VKGFVGSTFGGRPDPIHGSAEFHEGIDICAPYGSPVQAPADGLVVFAGWKTGYGNTIEISHETGLLTRYGHLSKILVTPGQKVTRWQKIGSVGTSGRTTGSHLHYEVRRDDRPLNPKSYILF
jgi:murein DD-endopeptidase MepM/ murein hydrolase activator NlpD